jgi:HD-GYP domain-containing protein (c-di-GMP phosphodiesterase class II)
MPSAVVPNVVDELGAQLEQAFATRFKLSRADDQAECWFTDAGSDHLQGDASLPKPFRLWRRGDRVRLCLALQVDGKHYVRATATFPRRCGDQVRRTARLFVKQFELQRRVADYRQHFNDCATLMGRQLEEFALLHKLAEQLQQMDLTQQPWSLAELVLPIVADVIQAEALVLLPHAQVRCNCRGVEACPSEARIVVGDSSVCTEQECHSLVAACFPCERRLPYVRNSCEPVLGWPPQIRNLVVAGLFSSDVPLGWLLAINRRDRQSPAGLSGPGQFGSVEAQLLNSIAAMLASQARNVGLYRERETLLVSVVRALVSAVDAKDPYTCGHSERVALVARRLAQECGLDEQECDRVYLTGLLHDVGKIGVSDAVLGKPGKLTPEEFDEIKRHTELGWSILCELEQLHYVLPGVLHHHETYHGQGYPDALSGHEIPFMARILAVADAFDAMASDRPYRSGMALAKVTAILREGAGSQWDPLVIERFFAAFDEIESLWKEHASHHSLQNRRARQRDRNDLPRPCTPDDARNVVIAELFRHP